MKYFGKSELSSSLPAVLSELDREPTRTPLTINETEPHINMYPTAKVYLNSGPLLREEGRRIQTGNTQKLKLDLREAAAVTPPQHIMESGCPRDDRTEEVSDTSDDTFSSPIFSDHWQVRGCFSAAGGSLQKKGSDVVLQVPAGAIQVKTKVTVHAAVCANDVYIKHKLQLPSTETIVSPLAEFSASTDLPFQKHVQITLPTCLLSNYNVHTCHVYCIRSEKPESQITISELGRLEELSETSEKEKPAAYFYVNGKGQVVVMTTHFSGYIFQLNWDKIECTKCINIPAIKYTELGPFCACWTLMSPEGATPSTLEICVRVSHSQIQGQLEPDSSCAPIEIDVRQHTEDENRFSNGSNDKTTINVQYLLGDLHLAPQPSSTG
ncbi:hypothetical protein C0Q70_03568 [Pomacea canaliculata]|uniref:ZU5 domain-containing protein n=1 Tax=Pomacea canaliculata TaxID=400727 RepID=A0A2T7PT24_POMCA|nr:hypothetical protein C0Q70_03568 [Pomacea canaliculata]